MSANKLRGLIEIHPWPSRAQQTESSEAQRPSMAVTPELSCGHKCQAGSTRRLQLAGKQGRQSIPVLLLQESQHQIMPAGLTGSTQHPHPATPGLEGSAQGPALLGKGKINGNGGVAVHFHGSAKELIYPGVHTQAL